MHREDNIGIFVFKLLLRSTGEIHPPCKYKETHVSKERKLDLQYGRVNSKKVKSPDEPNRMIILH